nr:hypothetical protein [Caldalkalibacillus thermarum]
MEFGHWEIDTVLGTNKKGAALLTLTERKTRKEHILKIDHKTAECVKQALQELKQQYGSVFSTVFKTITSDNGRNELPIHSKTPLRKGDCCLKPFLLPHVE